MNYSALIQNRKSVREFLGKRVPESDIAELEAYYNNDCMRLVPELKTELVMLGRDKKDALESAAGYQKPLGGEPEYMILLTEKNEHALENAGYIMEDMILKLTDMGLGSCWITFTDSDKVKAAVGIDSALEVGAIAAFGYGAKAAKRLRINILSMSNIDIKAKREFFDPKKAVSDIVFMNSWGNKEGVDEYIGFFDDMLWEALYAVSLSPSYLNRQPYGFVIKDNTIVLVEQEDSYTDEIDGKIGLGIVMQHFAAVVLAWNSKFAWNIGGDIKIDLPKDCKAAASCRF